MQKIPMRLASPKVPVQILDGLSMVANHVRCNRSDTYRFALGVGLSILKQIKEEDVEVLLQLEYKSPRFCLSNLMEADTTIKNHRITQQMLEEIRSEAKRLKCQQQHVQHIALSLGIKTLDDLFSNVSFVDIMPEFAEC